MESLREHVRNDFKTSVSGLDDLVNQRVNQAEKAILESSRAREAMVAGIGTMRKSLEKAQRKFSRNNDLAELRETLVDIYQNINRLRLANDKISDEISMVLHPNVSAVDIVEKFASDIQRFAGTWERIAREIDQSISEMCDDQEPSELIELENYIENQGFDKLINHNPNHKRNIESE
tara:strand:- start:652 stop:1182 length:531 start_codon:yes stop_codon:yes gene_type:complete